MPDEPCQEFPSEVNGNNTARLKLAVENINRTKPYGKKYKPSKK
jgi:hypothetical protein